VGRVRDEKDEEQHHETLVGLLHGWKKEAAVRCCQLAPSSYKARRLWQTLMALHKSTGG
jgi:hypothetical protein